MNDSEAPPPPYSYTPPPGQSQQQSSPVVGRNPLQRNPNVPPPLPPRTPSFATANTHSSPPVQSRQISVSSPGGIYSYSTGISYPSPQQDRYTSPQHEYTSPTHQYTSPTHQYTSPIHQYTNPTQTYSDQARLNAGQQAESECYLYPGSYRDPIDPRDVKRPEEAEETPPPLPPRQTATRGESFISPIPKKPMAPPSVRLDPGIMQGTTPVEHPTGAIDLTHDPRSRSVQSIPPAPLAPQELLPRTLNQQQYQVQSQPALQVGPRKRKLLLVYIHGFLGSTTSFNHFPSHLHNLLTYLLANSCPQYTVHTKIYPRFKTRHAIGEAADMFSQWLSDFEDEGEVPGRMALRHSDQPPNEETDVILLGHSMGGLLAGEIVLLPRLHPVETDTGARRYRHRILGIVGFDSPFLGMHPGVVTSGISSLFRSSPKPDKRKDATPLSPTTHEEGPSAEDLFLKRHPEHFDTGLQSRPDSGNRGLRNFLTKHSGNLPGATVQYLLSHMEFAACLADPIGLSTRYRRLRGLEDGKDYSAPGGGAGVGGYQVRFVNYYTVCFGKDKEKERERERERMEESVAGTSVLTEGQRLEKMKLMGPTETSQHKRGLSTASVATNGTATSISTTATTDERSGHVDVNGISPASSPGPDSPRSSTSTPPPLPPPHIVPVVPRHEESQSLSTANAEASLDRIAILNSRSERYSLPIIPPAPVEPPLHADLSHITDQRLQKLHMKENKRLWKEHFRQEKAHRRLIKDREKVLAKLEGKVAESPKPPGKESGSKEKVWEKWEAGKSRWDSEKNKKKVEVKKERKFCVVPKEAKSVEGGLGLGEDGAGGEGETGRDETWVKVPMGYVDEVAAHCGLFMAGAEIFETPSSSSSSFKSRPREGSIVGDKNTIPLHTTTNPSSGRPSMDITSPPPGREKIDEEKQELEFKRRQYERLVGDLADRIEGWVKEHAGSLEAFEVAGQGMQGSYRKSLDEKKFG